MADEIVAKLVQVLNTYPGRDKAIRSLYFALVLISTRLSRRRAKYAERLLEFARQMSRMRLVARQLNFVQLFNAARKVPAQLCQAARDAVSDCYRDTAPRISMRNAENSLTANTTEKIVPSSSTDDVEAHSTSTIQIRPTQTIGALDAVWRVVFTCRGSSALGRFADETLACAVTLLYSLNAIVEFCAWIAEARLIPADASRWFRYSLLCWIGALSAGILRFALSIHRRGWTSAASVADRVTLLGLAADLVGALNMLPSVKLRRGGEKLTLAQSASFFLAASLIGFYKCF